MGTNRNIDKERDFFKAVATRLISFGKYLETWDSGIDIPAPTWNSIIRQISHHSKILDQEMRHGMFKTIETFLNNRGILEKYKSTASLLRKEFKITQKHRSLISQREKILE